MPFLQRNITNDTFDSDLTATTAECSWIASVVVLIVPAGAISGGFIMDSIGRLNTIKLATVPTILGWCLIAAATNVNMIIAGRLFCGFGSAWGTIPATVYISEISRADLRGALVSFTPTLASLGMLICFAKGSFLHWRTVAWMANLYVVVSVVLLFLIPESPAWLISKGRDEEAAASLRWIHKYQPQPQNRFFYVESLKRTTNNMFVNTIGTSDQTWVPVALLVMYVVTCMIGLLPLPWTITAELFPIEIRGVANSLSFSMANVFMFGAIQSFWTMDRLFGGMAGIQWFYAAVAFISSIYSFIFLPETHRKKLTEISEYFLTNTIYLGSTKSAGKLQHNRVSKEHSAELNIEQGETLLVNRKD
nr:facilitated trehalose transporter Tret1-like [Leptinotarsa decemlineata]